jgi:DNA (cytosine-5)-methyltransferase 1
VSEPVKSNSSGIPSLLDLGFRPRLLDLFCGGGGMGTGYYLAGFEIVGVDIVRQPRYPFAFFQADALEFLRLYGDRFDAIHASPPCQAYSRLAARHPERVYPDLVGPTRELLQALGKPYVIENVPEAPLRDPAVLCGSAFGLGTDDYQLRRHRAFETNWPLFNGAGCAHDDRPVISVAGHAGRAGRNNSGSSDERREAMGTPWLAGDSLPEAIPPRYGEYIGRQLFEYLARDLVAEAVA